MDILQDYAVQAYHLYTTIDPYLQPVRDLATQARAQLYPVLLPLVQKGLLLAQDSPAIISVGFILLFLLIIVQLLNFVRRVMMWWTRLMMGLMFWGALGLLVVVVAQRGVGRTVTDLCDWGVELSDVWWREYRRWEGYQNQSRAGRAGVPRGGVKAGSSWR